MAQSNELSALRKRIQRRGYKRVHISLSDDGSYWVRAYEPLAGFPVQAVFGPDEIGQIFKRVK